MLSQKTESAIRFSRPARRPDRRIAAGSILFVVACVLAGEWLVPPLLGNDVRIFNLLVTLVILAGLCTHKLQGESFADIGLLAKNLPQAARLLAVPTLVAALALIGGGALAGSLSARRYLTSSRLGTIAWLLWWAVLQQYALQGIINRQAQVLWGRGRRSVIFVAALFALLHLPNMPLVLATFAGGWIWASVYQRAPDILAPALSHWLMVLLLTSTLPPSMLRGMRVGAGYFNAIRAAPPGR